VRGSFLYKFSLLDSYFEYETKHRRLYYCELFPIESFLRPPIAVGCKLFLFSE
jgi:hypothetical protein